MICSGPVASALLQSTVSGLRFGYGLDSYVSTRFSTLYNQVRREKTDALMATQGPLILWTGAVAAAGSLIGISYRGT